MQPRVVIIGGPTASGKTSLAIAIARKLKTDIISFDSRQLYQELNIGVARPTPEELNSVRHHFIAEASIKDPWTAARYAQEATSRLESVIHDRGSVVLCGGTGLYLKALTHGLDNIPGENPALREELNSLLRHSGPDALLHRLSGLDSSAPDMIDSSNPARLIRAIEILEAHPGKKLSELRKGQTAAIPYPCHYFGIDWPRETLYERIHERVDQMMASGLLEEVKGLSAFRHLSVMKTVGYAELFDYLDGHTDLETAVSLIRQHTRNYAKRQLTWFRNQTPMAWFNPGEAEQRITAGLQELGLF